MKRDSDCYGDPPVISRRRVEMMEAIYVLQRELKRPPTAREVCERMGYFGSTHKGITGKFRLLWQAGYLTRVPSTGHNAGVFTVSREQLERARKLLPKTRTARILEAARILVAEGVYPSAGELAEATGIDATTAKWVRRVLIDMDLWPKAPGVSRGQVNGVSQRLRVHSKYARDRQVQP